MSKLFEALRYQGIWLNRAPPVPYMYENVLDDLERRNVLVEGTPFPDFELTALPFTAHEICYFHPLLSSSASRQSTHNGVKA